MDDITMQSIMHRTMAMSRERMDIGATPHDEQCEQAGPNYNPNHARKECRAFINQLERLFPNIPDGLHYRISRNPHDFGTYHEVEIAYDPNDESHWKYALMVEENVPAHWDPAAKEELGI